MPRLVKATPPRTPMHEEKGIAELVKSMRASMPKEPVAGPKPSMSYEQKKMGMIEAMKRAAIRQPVQPKPITLRDVAKEVPGATRKVIGGIANQFIQSRSLRAAPRGKIVK